jgi:hypothetical protein
MRTVSLLLLPLLAGCVIGGDRHPRPRDLAPAWLLDRTRVLGMRAEPPEVRPAQIASFEALVHREGKDDPAIVWFACPPEDDGGIGFGCVLDLDELDYEASPEALAEAGLIGFEPFLPPSYSAPDDVLDGLAEEDRAEGLYVLIQLSALPAEVLEGSVDAIDFNEVEVAYKRLVVSEAATPNHNPELSSFTVDRHTVRTGDRVHVDRNQIYEIGVHLADGARESYEYTASSGVTEQRQEEPWAAWYSTGGELLEEVTLHPYMEAGWQSPKRSGSRGTWYAVVRDRRGGMSWRSQEWIVD